MNTREIQQHLIMDETDIQLKILQERNAEIRELEEGIIDNHFLMMQINLMVQAQGEKIDTIEAHIDKALDNTDDGVKSLQKAELHQRGCTIL